ncbi:MULTISPECIES: hypothetical protein [unclassified Streptomyces]|uniref:hypothetical protein n=1 Tax=unclassified Streptomyces TaxID=2593676 RepID=UPI0036E882D1
MLLRLAYPGVTNAFAVLRLLPMSDRDKDAEILALRHQITVLERQLGNNRARRPNTSGQRVKLSARRGLLRVIRSLMRGGPGGEQAQALFGGRACQVPELGLAL